MRCDAALSGMYLPRVQGDVTQPCPVGIYQSFRQEFVYPMMKAAGSSGDQTVFHYDDYLQCSGLHAAYNECSDVLSARCNNTKRTHT